MQYIRVGVSERKKKKKTGRKKITHTRCAQNELDVVKFIYLTWTALQFNRQMWSLGLRLDCESAGNAFWINRTLYRKAFSVFVSLSFFLLLSESKMYVSSLCFLCVCPPFLSLYTWGKLQKSLARCFFLRFFFFFCNFLSFFLRSAFYFSGIFFLLLLVLYALAIIVVFHEHGDGCMGTRWWVTLKLGRWPNGTETLLYAMGRI